MFQLVVTYRAASWHMAKDDRDQSLNRDINKLFFIENKYWCLHVETMRTEFN